MCYKKLHFKAFRLRDVCQGAVSRRVEIRSFENTLFFTFASFVDNVISNEYTEIPLD